MRLIDAETLKKRIQLAPNKQNETWTELYDAVMYEIDNAPTVKPEKALIANVTFDEGKLKEIVQAEVIDKIKSGELVIKDERPQGEWIKIGEIGLAYKCDKCGEVDVLPTNFCPNCGAKRKGGAE